MLAIGDVLLRNLGAGCLDEAVHGIRQILFCRRDGLLARVVLFAAIGKSRLRSGYANGANRGLRRGLRDGSLWRLCCVGRLRCLRCSLGSRLHGSTRSYWRCGRRRDARRRGSRSCRRYRCRCCSGRSCILLGFHHGRCCRLLRFARIWNANFLDRTDAAGALGLNAGIRFFHSLFLQVTDLSILYDLLSGLGHVHAVVEPLRESACKSAPVHNATSSLKSVMCGAMASRIVSSRS